MMSKQKIYPFCILLFALGCGDDHRENIHPNVPNPLVTDLSFNERNALRNKNMSLVHQCGATAIAATLVEVSYQARFLCKLPDHYHELPIKYQISGNGSGKISIRLNVSLEIQPIEREAEIFKEITSCSSVARNVFNRYGINFDLKFHRASSLTPYHYLVQVLDAVGESTPTRWNLRGKNSKDDRPHCNMILHEIGHLLGITDEYEQASCPDRMFISRESNPYSIMEYIAQDVEYMDFYPRHISTFIQPACPSVVLMDQ